MNKVVYAILCLLFAHSAHSGLIITSSTSAAVVERITGVNLGTLGTVDVEFAGSNFNQAFGTGTPPAGFLFPSTSSEAFTISASLRSILNTYNLNNPSTPVNFVADQNSNSVQSRFYVAYNIQLLSHGNVSALIRPGTREWIFDGSSSAATRMGTGPVLFARITSADVPAPGTIALIGLGLAGVSFRPRKPR